MIYLFPEITTDMLRRSFKGEDVELIAPVKGHVHIIPKGYGILGVAKYYYEICVN